ncbi:phage antitermination protein Q [Klebsiella pneumoniae]|uniref:Phage antitermination protein Q n=1 Tax=Klebsiella pneumoniae TaxID=573 RepID=A0A2X3EE23_KLEPN|nr:phage antitermination protein Q [Klebsiella pneumoniae]
MSRDVIERIRDRWQKLRLLRSRGTVLVDYRILRNFVRIYQTLGRDSMTAQYLEFVRQQLIVATADLSGATKGQLIAFAENAQFTATARSRGRKKVADPVTGRMVNPSSPPIPGQQSRAKGSSIALVLPVEYSTASWRRLCCRWKSIRKRGCCGITATISAGSTRRRSPGGHGSNSTRSWPACASQRKQSIACVNLSGWLLKIQSRK